MMNLAYGAWIAEHYPTPESAYGKCAEAVKAMTAAFPELRPARGFFFSIAWGEREHHWCVVKDGTEIVDPTRHQFPDGGSGVGAYEELVGTDEEIADRVPTGVCMDCGSPVYRGKTFCNEDCEAATLAYLQDPRSDAEKDDYNSAEMDYHDRSDDAY